MTYNVFGGTLNLAQFNAVDKWICHCKEWPDVNVNLDCCTCMAVISNAAFCRICLDTCLRLLSI